MTDVSEFTQGTVHAINTAMEGASSPRHSFRIGGSTVGHPCERYGWYKFRWAVDPETFTGKKLRVFATGHAYEDRMIAMLRNAGIGIQDRDPDTRDQWAIEALDGHFMGYADGIVTGVIEAPKARHLFEAKTHNEKSFKHLVKYGVAVSKPEHVAQMQVYMHGLGLTRALYLAVNKNTDELYSERIEYDAAHALSLMAKAERIRDAHDAPARVRDDDKAPPCMWCPAADVCHQGAPALRNCRTCLHSSPIAQGRWHCARHDTNLTYEKQRQGCQHHLYLPSLVAGDQVDADSDAQTITYAMASGQTWVDGEGRVAS